MLKKKNRLRSERTRIVQKERGSMTANGGACLPAWSVLPVRDALDARREPMIDLCAEPAGALQSPKLRRMSPWLEG
jgi:hypothetical protein